MYFTHKDVNANVCELNVQTIVCVESSISHWDLNSWFFIWLIYNTCLLYCVKIHHSTYHCDVFISPSISKSRDMQTPVLKLSLLLWRDRTLTESLHHQPPFDFGFTSAKATYVNLMSSFIQLIARSPLWDLFDFTVWLINLLILSFCRQYCCWRSTTDLHGTVHLE